MVDTTTVENDRSLAESVSELEELAQKALELEGEAREELIQEIKTKCAAEGLSEEDTDELLEEIGLIQEKATLPGSKDQGDTAPQKLPGNAEDVTPAETLKPGQNATKKVAKRRGDQEGKDGEGPKANPVEDMTKKMGHVNKESIEFSVSEDVKALLEGEEFSEEFAQKATTIFEAAVNTKVASILDELQEGLNVKFNEELEKSVEEQRVEMVEKIDNYLNYVVEQWMEENKLAVEQGIRADLTENFLSGLKTLFEQHYVTIPDEKVDVVDELFEQVDTLQSQLNKEINKSVSMTAELNKYKKQNVIQSVTEGLSALQAEKVKALAENIDDENIEAYAKKVEVIKENYFPAEKPTTLVEEVEQVDEKEQENAEEISDTMKYYTSAIAKSIR